LGAENVQNGRRSKMMRTLWIVAIALVVAVSLGCGQGGKAGDESKGGGGKTDGAEAAAKQMLTAMQKGDIGTLLDCTDLKTMYDQTPEQQREGKSFDEWKTDLRQQAEAGLGTDFTFEVTGSEAVGDVTLVKVKVTKAEGEPEETDIPFKKVDGQWKATPEGFGQIMTLGI
jgi:hypothetical protein